MFLSHDYFTDKEYEGAFFEFGGARRKIAEKVRELSTAEVGVILDLLSGHGLLSAEMAICFPKSRILGIGLQNDVISFKQVLKSNYFPQETWTHFHYLVCNAASMPIRSTTCDIVINFLGLEDVHMTSGRSGVERTIDEVARITKKDALIQISFVDYEDSPTGLLTREIWESIGLNAIFYEREEYLRMLEERRLYPLEEFEIRIKKKMTPNQAREELMFACKEAPIIFSNFGVRSMKFDDLWSKFGERVEKYGMAFWSKIHVIILTRT
jgi:ubiquinone/menaquinone biosynthesis C-methylase UbiE